MTTNQQPAVPTREYLAFISYRHADNKQQGRQWATWLHQALETYEVPADLVGKPNSRGEIIPERIYPIFRDEDELPAHANLANSITDALTNSRLLVVLCSPNAVASTYVADEIQYFKKLGHSNRIIAAMIDGEPNASWDVAKQESGVSASAECFPLPLQFIVNEQGELTDQRAEPIAADFRVNIHGQMHQGWTNAEALRQHLKSSSSLSESEIKTIVASYQQQLQLMLLKIIAGVLGVPLGELTKRDQAYQLEQQRKRTKRLRQWLSAVGVLAVMAVGASVYAWQQRSEAIAQRDKAEALLSNVRESLSFMNSDLREIFVSYVPTDKRVEVMKQVDSLASALQQYSIVNNSKDQRQIAVALLEKADLLMENKDQDPSEAAAIQEQANSILKTLLIQDPNNVSLQSDLSLSYSRLALSYQRQGNEALAIESLNKALYIDKGLLALDSTNLQWQYNLSINHTNLSDVYANANKFQNSLLELRKALEIAENLIDKDPSREFIYHVYTIVHKLSLIHGKLGNRDDAIKFNNAEIEAIEYLQSLDPNNKKYLSSLAESHNNSVLAYGGLKTSKSAVVEYEKAVAIYEELIRLDPKNTNWLESAANTYNYIAMAYTSNSKYYKSIHYHQKSISIYKDLLFIEPENFIWNKIMSQLHNDLGDTYAAYNDYKSALKAYLISVDIYKKLVSSFPDKLYIHLDLSNLYSRIGQLYIASNDLDMALEYFVMAMNLRQESSKELALAHSHRDFYNLAEVYKYKGELDASLNNHKVAIDILEKILFIKPDFSKGYDDMSLSGDALEKLGKLYEEKGDEEKALDIYRDVISIREKVIDYNGEKVIWNEDLCLSYLKLGDFFMKKEDAYWSEEYYYDGSSKCAKLLVLEPENKEYQKILLRSHYKLAKAYRNQKKYILAASVLMDAIKVLGVDVTSKNALNDMQIRLLIQESDLYLSWSWYLLLSEEYAKISSVLKRVVDYLPEKEDSHVAIHSNLAHSLLLSGETDEAESIYGMFKGYVFKDGKVWDQLMIDDFKALRESGINSREFDRIAKEVFLINLE
ncbi:TPA: tetratricopeptide repeat protein [Vibrio cholerae]